MSDGRCAPCTWWGKNDSVPKYGWCGLPEGDASCFDYDSGRIPRPIMYATDRGGDAGAINCREDFGCVQWEGK